MYFHTPCVCKPAAQSLSPLVRLAVEAQVRAADWRVLAAQQAAAAAAGQPADAVTWPALERHMVGAVRLLLEALPQVSDGGPPGMAT